MPGGRFTGGRQIDPMPWLDGAPTPDVGGARAFSSDPNCVRGFGSAGGALADGKVPAELEIWYRRAGTVCPEISSSLLAAQAKQESGFRRGLTSPAGAQGLAQFLPGTAASINPEDGQPYIIDADGNGSASVWDDGDAIIGQARYMCSIAHKIAGWMAAGRVSGDLAALTLAYYNAGEGAVLASGGCPISMRRTIPRPGPTSPTSCRWSRSIGRPARKADSPRGRGATANRSSRPPTTGSALRTCGVAAARKGRAAADSTGRD